MGALIKIVRNKKLLHIICKKKFKKKRSNISTDDKFLQVAELNLKKNDTFKPHMHIWKVPKSTLVIAQESWIVLEGKVKISTYDTMGKFIKSFILNKGDYSITYEGGHTYTSLTHNTRVLEYKTGPYEGIERDKVFI
jgi:cupin fold WbuC family metalloprotein